MEKYHPHTYENESPSTRADIRKQYVVYEKSDAQKASESSLEGRLAIATVEAQLKAIHEVTLFSIFKEQYGKSGIAVESFAITPIAEVEVFLIQAIQCQE